MKIIQNTIKILLITILLTSCNAYKSINITGVEGVEFKGMMNNKISLELKVPIENPNWYKIKIKSMDFDVTVNGSFLGTMKNSQQIVIPSKSDTLQVFPVDIYVKNLFGAMSTLNTIRRSKSVDMQIEGSMKVRALLSGKTVKISEKQRVSL